MQEVSVQCGSCHTNGCSCLAAENFGSRGGENILRRQKHWFQSIQKQTRLKWVAPKLSIYHLQSCIFYEITIQFGGPIIYGNPTCWGNIETNRDMSFSSGNDTTREHGMLIKWNVSTLQTPTSPMHKKQITETTRHVASRIRIEKKRKKGAIQWLGNSVRSSERLPIETLNKEYVSGINSYPKFAPFTAPS